jgi:tetratricopeptide (TPR) repeat protein
MRFGRWSSWIVLVSSLSFAQSVPPAFQHFYNLEYDEALALFTRDAAEHPEQAQAQNNVAQTVLFRAMYQHGALESDLIGSAHPFSARPKLPVTAAETAQFEGAIAKSIDLSQKRLAANANDAEALYAMGVAIGLRANWNYLVHKAWMEPLKDATQARKYHLQATNADPNFHDARLVQGVHDYLIGSLPFTVKMMGFLAGFRGDREEGIRTLRVVATKGVRNKADAAVLLAAILRREKKQEEAVPLLVDMTNQFPRNYLFRFELALLYADLHDGPKALAQIDAIEQFRAKGTAGFAQLKSERIAYMRGQVYFLLREYDQALPQLWTAAKASVNGDLDVNAVAQAWLRLGQTYDAKGRRQQALAAYKRAVDVGPQTASGKEAKDYMSSPFKHKAA